MEIRKPVKIDINELINEIYVDPRDLNSLKQDAWENAAQLWTERFGVPNPQIPDMDFFLKCIRLKNEENYEEIFLLQIRSNCVMHAFTLKKGKSDWDYVLFYIRSVQKGVFKECYPPTNIKGLESYEANLGEIALQFELPKNRAYVIDSIFFNPLEDCNCD